MQPYRLSIKRGGLCDAYGLSPCDEDTHKVADGSRINFLRG